MSFKATKNLLTQNTVDMFWVCKKKKKQSLLYLFPFVDFVENKVGITEHFESFGCRHESTQEENAPLPQVEALRSQLNDRVQTRLKYKYM